jgi:hypothetical protein
MYLVRYDDGCEQLEEYEDIIPEEAMGALDEESSGSRTQLAGSPPPKKKRRRLVQKPTQVI